MGHQACERQARLLDWRPHRRRNSDDGERHRVPQGGAMRRATSTVGAVLVAVLMAAPVGCGSIRGESSSLPPTLILISMDGFRSDYIERVETPHLDRVIAGGVRAEGLIPPFPSKTFPGHYTLVTGLYPGHHGIISNNMRDPGWPEEFGLNRRREVENGRWWGGEPIWVAAQRQGLRSAVYFWPGSEAAVQGVRPTHWYKFDASVPFEARVDQVLEWIDLPANERPVAHRAVLGRAQRQRPSLRPVGRRDDGGDSSCRCDRWTFARRSRRTSHTAVDQYRLGRRPWHGADGLRTSDIGR